jgi:hypothetical protein
MAIIAIKARAPSNQLRLPMSKVLVKVSFIFRNSISMFLVDPAGATKEELTQLMK